MDLSNEDYLHAAYCDAIVEGLSIETVIEIHEQAETAEEFFAGVHARIQLQEIVEDHYDQTS